jgi:hypothetical protein
LKGILLEKGRILKLGRICLKVKEIIYEGKAFSHLTTGDGKFVTGSTALTFLDEEVKSRASIGKKSDEGRAENRDHNRRMSTAGMLRNDEEEEAE